MNLDDYLKIYLILGFEVWIFTRKVSEWLLFNSKSVFFFSYIMENKFNLNEMMTRSTLYQINTFNLICIVPAHWNNSLWIDMSPNSDTLSCFCNQPVFALSPLCCMPIREATNANFIVFSLTRSGIEPMIYCTWGEHANNYTTDAVFTSEKWFQSSFEK